MRAPTPRQGSPGEVFRVFLKLGLTSFGGPIAHLGYYRNELVVRRRWIDEAGYADLVALAQFLPGPASSQVGFALGLLRGGPLGGLAAWAAFTLPSAAALVLFAYGSAAFAGPLGGGVLHGLKIVAVAIVAQAVWGMARTLCPDRERASIAVAGALLVTFVGGAIGQIAAIALGALAGFWLCRTAGGPGSGQLSFPLSTRAGAALLAAFFALLLILPLLNAALGGHVLALLDAFYRAGALVFGGGHVVLPLLQASVVPNGWVSNDAFLAGYGAAQAVPGPLTTFAAYLGAVMGPAPNGWAGAVICLVAVFLPSFLLVIGALPFWETLRHRPALQAALRGVNAAVVGLLLAALYDPVWTAGILSARDFALAAATFLLLYMWQVSPWIVVILCAVGGALL